MTTEKFVGTEKEKSVNELVKDLAKAHQQFEEEKRFLANSFKKKTNEIYADIIESIVKVPEEYDIRLSGSEYLICYGSDVNVAIPRDLSQYTKAGEDTLNKFHEIAESKSRASYMDMLDRYYDKDECVYIPSEGVLIRIDPELNKELSSDDVKLQKFVNDFISEHNQDNPFTYYAPSFHILSYAKVPQEFKESVVDKYRTMDEDISAYMLKPDENLKGDKNE